MLHQIQLVLASGPWVIYHSWLSQRNRVCTNSMFFFATGKKKSGASTEVFRLNRWPIIWSKPWKAKPEGTPKAKPLMLFHVCVLSFCRSLNWKTTSSMPFFLLFPLCGAGSFKKSTGDSVDVLRNSFIFQFPRKFGTICSQASQYIRKRSTLGSQYIGNRKMRDLFHSVFHCKIAFHGFYLVSNQHLQEAPPSDLSRKSPNLTTPKIQT